MSISKNISYVALSQVISMGLGFISGIFITRILGPEGKGVFAKLNAGVGLSSLLFGFNFVMGIIYFISNKKIPQKKVLGIGFLSILVSLSLLGIWVGISSELELKHLLFPKDNTTPFIILFFILSFLLSNISSFCQGIAQGKKLFKYIFIFTIITSLLNVFTFGFIYFSELRIVPNDLYTILILNLLISSIISVGWILKVIRTIKNVNFNISIQKDLKPFYKYAFPGFMALIANFILLKIDIWFIEYFRPTRELGFYAQAANVSQIILAISFSFKYVLFPYLSNNDNTDNLSLIKLFSRVNLTLSSLVCLLVFFLSDYFFPLLYGAEFKSSVAPFKILIISTLLLNFRAVFMVFNFAKNKAKYNLITNILTGALMIVLDLILIPKYGIIGAAWASLIAYFINALITFLSVVIPNDYPFSGYFILSKGDLVKIINLVKSKLG